MCDEVIKNFKWDVVVVIRIKKRYFLEISHLHLLMLSTRDKRI